MLHDGLQSALQVPCNLSGMAKSYLAANAAEAGRRKGKSTNKYPVGVGWVRYWYSVRYAARPHDVAPADMASYNV